MEHYRVPVADEDRTRAGLAMQMVALTTGVSLSHLNSRDRLAPRACRARWTAMYLAHIGYGWSLERVGHAFGFNRATASSACRWAEDERDRPAYDNLLDQLVDCLGALGEAQHLNGLSDPGRGARA